MPTCENCRTRWKWSQTVRRLLTLGDCLKCPACRREQFLTVKSRKRTGVYVFAAPLLMFVSVAFGIDPFASLGLFLMAFLLLLAVTPFFIELTNDKGPMW